LFGLSQSTYIDNMLKRFSMEEFKKRYLHILYKIRLSNDMHFKIQIKRNRMEMIPYILDIRFIIYVMLCTRLDVSYALSLTSRYQSNLGKGH
jgi:hypothetical protein